MSQNPLSVGKLLPNITVTVGKDELEPGCSNINEQEMSEDSYFGTVRPSMGSLQNPKIYINKDGGFATGLDLLSEENAQKLDRRAERFGLDKNECSKTNLNALYKSMGISFDEKHSAKMKFIRLDTLHMRGVEELETIEIFHYFKSYIACRIEWINDQSCNVVFPDTMTCARALLGVTRPFPSYSFCKQIFNPAFLGTRKSTVVIEEIPADSLENTASTQKITEDPEILDLNLDIEEGEEMDVDDIEDKSVECDPENKSVECDPESKSVVCVRKNKSVEHVPKDKCPWVPDVPVPPGNWRLGVPHPKAKIILLRFATKADKKLPGAEKRSKYYQKHGNPNYGGLRGLISSSRKQKAQAAANRRVIEKRSSKHEESASSAFSSLKSDSFGRRQKPLRMRMYADEEELKAKKRSWSRDDPKEKRSVHSRLGSKYTRDDLCRLGTYRDYDRDYDRGHDRDRSYYDAPKYSQISRPKNLTDLRSKLKKLRSDDGRRMNTGEHSKNYVEEEDERRFNVREKNKSYFKRKHRSPLCADDDDDDEEEEEDDFNETSSSGE